MQLSLTTLLALLAATTNASSVCDYFKKQCGDPCNKQQVGNTPLNCTYHVQPTAPPPPVVFIIRSPALILTT
ncbi:hypothetical protein GRF29_164g846821 [Pseudopithomyces chartarum]|uniref:Uncharacterized protein n=1 Tax=Pseudopithomyces chartarum TaxID=1892770 RepID=A0AAN6RDR0_9PLEO|nr:hypothetical protein GRF29_164g846821 [Pseudopithomyces chartarum]